MEFDLTKIPETCHHLIPLVERWGIGDDFDREDAVTTASQEELEHLVASIQALPTEELYDWLVAEADQGNPSPEYLAFTCMTMAYDSARVTLAKKRNRKS